MYRRLPGFRAAKLSASRVILHCRRAIVVTPRLVHVTFEGVRIQSKIGRRENLDLAQPPRTAEAARYDDDYAVARSHATRFLDHRLRSVTYIIVRVRR